jgi:signal peptidase I
MTAVDNPLDQSASVSLATAKMIQAHLNIGQVRLTIKSGSMFPALRVGDQVLIKRASADQLRLGDVVVLRTAGALVAHRLIARRQQDAQLFLITKGDACVEADSPWHPSALVGVVIAVRRGIRETSLETRRARIVNGMLACLSENHRIANQKRNNPVYKVTAKGLRGGLKMLAVSLTVLFAMLLFFPSAEVSAAVTVSSFTVRVQGNQVQALWTTASEINNVGFNILRSNSQNGAYSKVNASIIPSQCLGCITGRNYAFTDNSTSPGQAYFYKLQSVDNRGSTHLFGPAATSPSGPTPTSTKVPATATQTATAITKTPTNTAVPSKTVPPNTIAANIIPPNTSTAAPIPDTSTPSPTTSMRALSTATFVPPITTQVAVALPVATSTRPAPSAPARPVATALPSLAAQAAPANSAVEVADSAGKDTPEEQAAAAPSAIPDPSSLVLFGLITALGCGSALSGGLAILVFARSLSRR